jgi:hypothetical protein
MAKDGRLAQRPLQAEGVVTRELDGEVVLLDLSNEEYYSLNDVGSRVWELMDGERTVTVIVDAVVAEYEVERAEVEADVLALLGALADEGLVSWRDD